MGLKRLSKILLLISETSVLDKVNKFMDSHFLKVFVLIVKVIRPLNKVDRGMFAILLFISCFWTGWYFFYWNSEFLLCCSEYVFETPASFCINNLIENTNSVQMLIIIFWPSFFRLSATTITPVQMLLSLS